LLIKHLTRQNAYPNKFMCSSINVLSMNVQHTMTPWGSQLQPHKKCWAHKLSTAWLRYCMYTPWIILSCSFLLLILFSCPPFLTHHQLCVTLCLPFPTAIRKFVTFVNSSYYSFNFHALKEWRRQIRNDKTNSEMKFRVTALLRAFKINWKTNEIYIQIILSRCLNFC
jgi:hypothetical protein